MTLALAGSLAGIALVDSFNPSLFVVQFILFATARPVPRLVAYLFGLLTVNFLGGLAFVAGMRAVVAAAVASISPTTGALILIGLGAAAFAFGVWYRAKPAENNGMTREIGSINLFGAFVLGMFVMFQELSTALPMVVAAERIAAAEMGWGWNVLALLGYNVVFALPLFAFLGAFILLRERFTGQLDAINRAIATWGPRITKYLALVLGAALILYGVSQWVGALTAAPA